MQASKESEQNAHAHTEFYATILHYDLKIYL